MGVGWGGAAVSDSIWLAVPFVIGGAAGNGAAIICNQLLVQRGAPDRYRGRALATIMSSNYALLGLGMAVAGIATDSYGARAVWLAAGCIYIAGAGVALLVTRWLPVAVADEEEAIEASAAAAATALDGDSADESSPAGSDDEGSARNGLERIASLLEEIEQRRKIEARRTT
jgi:MFS family permease